MSSTQAHMGDWVTLKADRDRKEKKPYQVLATDGDRLLIAPLNGLDADHNEEVQARQSDVDVFDTYDRVGAARPPEASALVGPDRLAEIMRRQADSGTGSSDLAIGLAGAVVLIVGVAVDSYRRFRDRQKGGRSE